MSTTEEKPPIPETQKAWLVVRRGKPSQALRFAEDVQVLSSKLGPEEVMVKIQAAALNPIGYKMMELMPNFLSKRPHVAEMDFSGVVIDANGTDLHNGQEVFGFVPGGEQRANRQGALAEYARVSRQSVIQRPSNISAVEASGLLTVGCTAYHMLFDVGKLAPGQSVFINGGSTSVGMFAAQMAKATGCTVTVAASTKREEFLKSLGVDTFIDYTKGPVHAQLERDSSRPKFNVIIEAVGNTDVELYTHSPAYLVPEGIFISVGPQPDGVKGLPRFVHFSWETMMRPKFLCSTPRTWKFISIKPTQEQMERVAQFVADGKLKPIVDSVFPFEDALKAYDRLMTSRACGKVVIRVDPASETS